MRVRKRRWRVIDIRAYERCRLLTLAGAGTGNAGRTLRLLTPFDLVHPVERRSRVRRVRPAAWRRACRQLIATSTPAGALLGAGPAKIDLFPYQLEPALALVRGLGSRVLLADDVGLGKTVQAALILAELRSRGGADRMLVLTPSGLRDQWVRELGRRFDIQASVADAVGLRRLSSSLPVGINPWTTLPVAVTSIDYAKRPEVIPSLLSCPWDVVVIDEAHGCAAGSDRGAAVSALAGRASYVVLITATPHSGDRDSFSSLCSVGSVDSDRLLVFRRSRQDVGLDAVRHIHRLQVRPTPAELRMHALLGRFTREVRRERGESSALACSVLHKRALSSAASLERSIARRLTTLSAGEADGCEQLALPVGDAAGEFSSEDEPPTWPQELGLRDSNRERRILTALAQAAVTAIGHESKIRVLQRLLRRIDEPAIVFTEYRDTLLHLERQLSKPTVLLHGGLNAEERLESLRRFSTGGRMVLLATDTAGQGLNLHDGCRIVVNLELPWNPIRLEQRIGRVDRIGQTRTAHAFHLIARGTTETGILERLKARLLTARADIRAPDPLGVGVDVESDAALPPGTALRAEGIAEAERLARARLLPPAGGINPIARFDEAGPALIHARRWRTRVRLGSRLMLLWCIGAQDGHGRPLESIVVPLLAPAAFAGLTVEQILQRFDAEFRGRVEAVTTGWQDEVARFHRALVSTRLDRDRAIALGRSERLLTLFQAGLFDRRDQRARAAAAAAEHDEAIDWAGRVASVAGSMHLTVQPPRLLLALAP